MPAIPLAALTLPLYVLVPTFYTETLGLPLASVGFALLIVRLFDAVNDPLIGWAGDRFRPRFGRRRMLFAPPFGATPLWLGGWGLALSLGYSG